MKLKPRKRMTKYQFEQNFPHAVSKTVDKNFKTCTMYGVEYKATSWYGLAKKIEAAMRERLSAQVPVAGAE